MAKPQTNLELLKRRNRHMIGACFIFMLALTGAESASGQRWNSWYNVGALVALFCPFFLWYMWRTPCLRCGKPLRRFGSNEHGSAAKLVTAPCPNCGIGMSDRVT